MLAHEVLPDAGAAARRAAAFVAEQARAAIAERGRFVVAFSGGNTPGEMLHLLAKEDVDWAKVFVAQVDERIAPIGSRHRNLTQLRTMLVEEVPIPPAQVLCMPVERADIAVAAQEYGQRLGEVAGVPPVLDLVQLGLGPDGHTASLVPDDPALEVTDADVAITASYMGWPRMTLTFPAINRARSILWLVTGAEKSAVVARLLNADDSIPAGRINRASALLVVDQAAYPIRGG
jgi:6-phosphogluconolactonase